MRGRFPIYSAFQKIPETEEEVLIWNRRFFHMHLNLFSEPKSIFKLIQKLNLN